jgi:hypothetical protein
MWDKIRLGHKVSGLPAETKSIRLELNDRISNKLGKASSIGSPNTHGLTIAT